MIRRVILHIFFGEGTDFEQHNWSGNTQNKLKKRSVIRTFFKTLSNLFPGCVSTKHSCWFDRIYVRICVINIENGTRSCIICCRNLGINLIRRTQHIHVLVRILL